MAYENWKSSKCFVRLYCFLLFLPTFHKMEPSIHIFNTESKMIIVSILYVGISLCVDIPAVDTVIGLNTSAPDNINLVL